jgi:hypothetical protein
MGLPLHRGPHRDYNELVMERVGQVEARWAGLRGARQRSRWMKRCSDWGCCKGRCGAVCNPQRKPLQLSRFDPLGQEVNFTEIDAMVEMLWPETAVESTLMEPNPAEQALIAPGEGSAARSVFSF